MKRPLNASVLRTLFLSVLLCSCTAYLTAQTTNKGFLTPSGILDTVYDDQGGIFSLGQLSTNDTTRSFYNDSPTISPLITPSGSCGTPGYFKLFLDAGSGLVDPATGLPGAPGSIYDLRLKVLCQVLTDISAFIPSPCTSSGQTVNIWVRNSSAANGVLAIATPFYSCPNHSSVSGVIDNSIWITLNSGKDAFTNVIAPVYTSGGGGTSAAFFHGSIAFNWGSIGSTALNWHTDLATAPLTGEVDLYTATLHEMMHALGLSTLIDYNGRTAFKHTLQYFTRYDTHLKTGTGSPLIISGSACNNMYQTIFNFTSPSSVLSPGGPTGCASGYQTGALTDNTPCSVSTTILYHSASWGSVPVYTPLCFERGSSLSHFEDQCYQPSDTMIAHPGITNWNNQYFLMSNSSPGTSAYSYATNPGAMKRYLKPEERKALCDIGYNVNTTYGNVANLNNVSYSGGACPGLGVVGINDGMTSGLYDYVSTGGAINISVSSLIANDYGATTVSCVEVIYGNGPLTYNSATNTYIYTPGTGDYGVLLLRYLPKNASGVVGNITYVYMLVANAACVGNPCNVVTNGGFENATPLFSGPYWGTNVACWTEFLTADLYTRGASGGCTIPGGLVPDVHPYLTTSTAANDHFAGLLNTSHPSTGYFSTGESITEALSTPLISGISYKISFWYRATNVGPAIPTNHLLFAVSPTLVPVSSYFTPGVLTTLKDFTIAVDAQWHYISTSLTYSSPTAANQLTILQDFRANPSTYPLGYGSYVALDDITIEPDVSLCTFTMPPVMCTSNPIINLNSNVVCGYSGTFTWETTPVTGGVPTLTHSSSFDPAAAYAAAVAQGHNGKVTICFSYIDGAGCKREACAETELFPVTPPIGGPSLVCLGSPATMTNAMPLGTWSSSNASVASIHPLTGVVTGITAGSATITYTGACGFVTKNITVGTAPGPITGAAVVCTGLTTPLYNSSTGGLWSSSNLSIATVDATTGVVTGVNAGSVNISYTLGAGCFSIINMTVNGPAPIGGANYVCLGSSTTFTNTTPSGTWSSANPSIATISPSGVISGMAIGTTTITYMLGSGCYMTKAIEVKPLPAAITGPSSVCIGSIISLGNSTPGGTWSSSNVSLATVAATTGMVTGVSSGTVIVSYTDVYGCAVTKSIAVNPLPTAFGFITMCLTTPVPLASSPSGGTWTSSNIAVATIGATSGMVYPVAVGSTLITYTLPTGCYMTGAATIVSSPSASTGPSAVCVGRSITIVNSTPGGHWSSSNNTIATVGITTGIVTGVSAGTVNITYNLGACTTIHPVTVNPQPSAISGILQLCTGSSQMLGNTVAGGTWSSSNANVSINATTGLMTGVSAGSAIITYMLATGCYTTTVVTVYPGGSCGPCLQFAGQPFTVIPASTISAATTYVAGNYYITGDITIAGNVTLNNAIWLIAPGVHIYVAPTGVLTVNGSHLYCCGGMWEGIEIRSNSSSRGRVALQGGLGAKPTLLEDAITGIKADGISQPTGSSAYVINCNNAIFNKNNTGILIKDYTPNASLTTGLPLEYEFHVENTIFTSRNLAPTTHPFTWPMTTGATGLKKISPFASLNPYIAPYALTTYSPTVCNNNSASIQTKGIELNNVGVQTLLLAYPGVKIGQANSAFILIPGAENIEFNLFEGLEYGVKAVNANAVLHNNVFCNMNSKKTTSTNLHDGGGEGVYAAMNNGKKYRLSIEMAYKSNGPLFAPTKSVNVFYDCRWATYALNYNIVKGESSSMYSTQSNSAGFYAEKYGYDIQTWPFENVSLTNNYIVNVANAIMIKELNPSSKIPMFLQGGQITVTGNNIRAAMWGSTPTTQYIDKGVFIENTVVYTPPPGYLGVAQVNVDNNTLADVYNGISFNTIQIQTSTTNRNTITTRAMPSSFGNPILFAIWHQNCTNDWVTENKITGPGYTNDNWRGVRIHGNTTHMVSCNEISNIGYGFEFEKTIGQSSWRDNTMTNNRKGFVLISAMIGQQGSPSTRAGNKWFANTGFAWNTSTIVQIFDKLSPPLNSKLYVTPGAYMPTFNIGSPAGVTYTYAMGNGLVSCSPLLIPLGCNPVKQVVGVSLGTIELGKQIIKAEIEYPNFKAQQSWTAQMETYKVLSQYPDVDFLPEFRTFKKMASRSRYELLMQMENYLARGQYRKTATLLSEYGVSDRASTDEDEETGVSMTDHVDANNIVENYRRFYEVCVHYAEEAVTNADSVDIEAMAQKCPIVEGSVVFNARALYNILFDTVRIFESNCDTVWADTLSRYQDTAGIRSMPVLGGLDGQQYKLHPNPNNGNFILQQLVADHDPVEIEIFDVVGRSIYKNVLTFSSATQNIGIPDKVPGLYVLNLRDSKGRSFKFKFVID